jgi:2-methylisocitrate lyase-like PEP mutase family enzyme
VFLRGLAPEGERVAETLRRAARYREAGASGLFVPLMRDEEDIAAIVRAAGMPVNAMALPGLASPERLRELGVRRLSAGSATGEAAYAAAHAAIAVFLESGQVTPASLGYGALNGLMVAVG